jgi:hypothetical protein
MLAFITNLLHRRYSRRRGLQGNNRYYAGGGGLLGLVLTALSVRRFLGNRRQGRYV